VRLVQGEIGATHRSRFEIEIGAAHRSCTDFEFWQLDAGKMTSRRLVSGPAVLERKVRRESRKATDSVGNTCQERGRHPI